MPDSGGNEEALPFPGGLCVFIRFYAIIRG